METVIKNAISSNFIPFIGLLFLLFLVRTNPLFDRRQTKLFVIAILINIVLLVVISADRLFAGNLMQMDWLFRRITSFLNFAASPAIPFLLFKILFPHNKNKLYWLPLLTNLAFCFASIFYKVVFFISETNAYGRGPLFFLPILTSTFYIVVLILKATSSHARNKKRERIFLFSIIVLLAFSMFLEIQFGFHYLSWDCSALGIILYYVMLNIHGFTIDPLTGVYNRLVYNQELATVDRAAECLIALIDINNFKQINDERGHEAGDQCLILFADILTKSMAGTATLYRIGGDEFALIMRRPSEERFAKALEKAREAAQQQSIQFACGTVVYHPAGNLHEALLKADAAMYENKSRMKA